MNSGENAFIRFGMIGCGRISHRFAQGLTAVEYAMLTHVWSRRNEATTSFCTIHGGNACKSLEELLTSDIDAVYIATLTDSHAEFCIAALEAGKHVLCEKPSAVNISQLDTMLALADRKGLLFMEAMKPPFFPLYRKLKEHLLSDPIGTAGYVRAGSAVADLPDDHPNFSFAMAGGALTQIAPYEAFLALDWLGPLVSLQSMGRFSGRQVDMFSILQSEHQGGYAQLYAGFDLHGKGDALICGPLGAITIHENWWNPVQATIRYLDGRTVELCEPFIAGGLNYETVHFCQLLRNGATESPVMTRQISRGMLGMLDEARRQIGLRFHGE